MMRRPMRSLEAAVQEVLWASPDALKPGEVLGRLEIEPPIAYSTVLTVLRRLWKKNLVTREQDGKAYRYTPTMTREEHVAATMSDAFAATADPSVALGHFVASLSDEDTSNLKKLLRKKK